MTWHRMFVLGLIAVGIGSMLVCNVSAAPQANDSHKINVGLQLYSLRAQLAKDVPGTLALVQKMGITDVEAAGFYNLTASQFREELDKHGLHASGAHFQWDQFTKSVDQVIQDARTIGAEYVTMPWIPHEGDFTLDNAHMAAQKFNEWGAKCAAAGLKFTYHPHGYEFRPYQGGTLFDVMVKETKPENVNYELDIFWAYDGGAQPAELMKKYPNRFVLMHLKDMKKSVKIPNYTGHEDVESDVALGMGQLPLVQILKEADRIGIKHYYIEDESSRSVQQIPQSIQYVRSLGY